MASHALVQPPLSNRMLLAPVLSMRFRHVRTWEPLMGLDYGLDSPAAVRISRSATRLAHCLGRPASAGAAVAASCGRPLSPVFLGHNTFVAGDGAISPVVVSPIRPSSAAGKPVHAL
jgi:hypothetical protein